MVEMRETAQILRHATARSLIVLDEIGRGTSTYDGVSIAWAVAEHIHDRIGAKTLFATHYHELAALAAQHPRVRNVSVAAREWKGEVVFLRKLPAGGTSRSFGVEVAKLAGLPPAVIARARAILRTLEAPGCGTAAADLPRPVVPGAAEAGVGQLGLFSPPPARGELSDDDARGRRRADVARDFRPPARPRSGRAVAARGPRAARRAGEKVDGTAVAPF